MTADVIPSQFTGQAAMEEQKAPDFDLKQYSYTPRDFTEDDVIIKVICCGICGSDLHTITCGWKKHDQFPAIVGHEIVGTVVRAGENTKHSLGDRVGFGAQAGSCQECDACKADLQQYCQGKGGMVGTYQGPTGSKVQPYNQGGYADYYQGNGYFAVKIPDAIESTIAAPMLCAGVTVFAPLKHYAAGPGKKVGIVGIGGLGHLAVQFAAALGAEVFAISHSESKKAEASKLGASGFLATKNPEEALASHKGSFDLILSTTAQPEMPLESLYMRLLKPRGNFVFVGLPDKGLPNVTSWSMLGKSLTGSLIGSPAEIAEMFEVAAKHGVKTWVETRPMAEATQAVQDMHEGKARFRYVLTN